MKHDRNKIEITPFATSNQWLYVKISGGSLTIVKITRLAQWLRTNAKMEV